MLRATILLVSMSCLGGCISASAKVHGGTVVDSASTVEGQGGVRLGFGYALSEESAVNLELGVLGGTDSGLQLSEGAEYVRLEDDFGWRVGTRFDVAPAGDRGAVWLQGALMVPIRKHRRSGGHEKGFQTRTQSRWSVSVQPQVGYVFASTGEPNDHRLGFGATVGLDWNMIARMR